MDKFCGAMTVKNTYQIADYIESALAGIAFTSILKEHRKNKEIVLKNQRLLSEPIYILYGRDNSYSVFDVVFTDFSFRCDSCHNVYFTSMENGFKITKTIGNGENISWEVIIED